MRTMALRNFWITATIDGQSTRPGFGPRSGDGGFDLTVNMRDNGDKIVAVRLAGYAKEDGTLVLRVTGAASDNELAVITTKR